MNLFDKRILANVQEPAKWLGNAEGDKQLEFAQLEQQLVASRLHLERQLEHLTDLQSYARFVIADSIRLDFGTVLNPDQITVRSQYVFKEGPHTIQQDNSRSLTEFALYGLHDKSSRARLECVGEGVPAQMNQQWLENSMDTSDLRADYGASLRKTYEKSTVIEAMAAFVKQQLLLSAFSARLQGHLNQTNLERVRRAVEGEAGLVVSCLKLELPGTNNRPLKDLVVIGSEQPGQGGWLLYAPGAPIDREWRELPDLRSLSLEIGSWTATEKGCDYLAWQSHAMDRQALSSHLNKVLQLPSLWRGVEVGPTSYRGSEVMLNLVYNQRAWIVAQEESVTPYAYRSATAVQRQLFARVNTELQALQAVSVRQGGFVSYEQFCFDLIKRLVEEHLSEKGVYVSINPDQIRIEISEDQQLTLTQLIVGEVSFYADRVGEPKYPRFIVTGGHPPLDALDIRNISSWSKRLRPGEQYIDMLRTVQLNPQHVTGAFNRRLYLAILKRKMYIAVMQAFFSGQLSAQALPELLDVVADVDSEHPPKAVMEDISQIGYSALCNLHIKRAKVVGVFVFRIQLGSHVEEYLFAPDAPDGRELWPFSEFVDAVKSRGYGRYFYEKVEEKYQTKVKDYLDQLELRSNFTEAPALERYARIENFQACYSELIYKVISDVDEKTQSMAEIIFGLIFDGVVTAVTALSFVFPPVGVALSVVLFTKEAVSGLDALVQGDRAKALKHFVEAIAEMASLGKAGAGKRAASKMQSSFVSLIGDVYKIESFYRQATGHPSLPDLAKDAIQEILDSPQALTSKTTII
ncbi:dermonecrotic toxin domain-containing protein [Pseudomonas sp. NPDC088429]|uniref:dermonecrotic toxin domain-containing protein n=1 Tax=Pseudomonas sp. NPDC088429 TaxID=3364455 RepID=UPI003806CBAA